MSAEQTNEPMGPCDVCGKNKVPDDGICRSCGVNNYDSKEVRESIRDQQEFEREEARREFRQRYGYEFDGDY